MKCIFMLIAVMISFCGCKSSNKNNSGLQSGLVASDFENKMWLYHFENIEVDGEDVMCGYHAELNPSFLLKEIQSQAFPQKVEDLQQKAQNKVMMNAALALSVFEPMIEDQEKIHLGVSVGMFIKQLTEHKVNMSGALVNRLEVLFKKGFDRKTVTVFHDLLSMSSLPVREDFEIKDSKKGLVCKATDLVATSEEVQESLFLQLAAAKKKMSFLRQDSEKMYKTILYLYNNSEKTKFRCPSSIDIQKKLANCL